MSELFLFDRCNLINSALVATTFKRGIKEYVNELQRKAGADDTLAEAEHIRIIVQPRIFRAKIIGAARRTDSLHFIRRDGDADARAAAEDAFLTGAAGHSARSLCGDWGVIDRFCGICAEILVGNAPLLQMLFDGFFELISAVVGSKCDHVKILPIIHYFVFFLIHALPEVDASRKGRARPRESLAVEKLFLRQ